MAAAVVLLLLSTPVILAADHAPRAAQGIYTLPPQKLKLAQALYRIRTLLHFGGVLWNVLQLLLLLFLRIPARLQRLTLRVTRNRWGQCFVFTFLLLLITAALDLPLTVYAQHVRLSYGLSVQGWTSWIGDLAKDFVIAWGSTGLAAMLLFWIIGRSPRRWWAWFWLPAMAAVIFGVFIAPVVIDPLFNHFSPLAASNPALVQRLEQVVARGPLQIAPERMFLMNASAKETGINAYVTGIGGSKRVVVWDTAIAKSSLDEVSYIFGHEMGHYALGHIPKTLAFVGVLMLFAFWLGAQMAAVLLQRFGSQWQVASPRDWAAFPVYLMVLAILTFASEPIVNAWSRAQEHAADVYGQEAIYGIVADPQAVAARSFQGLGESALEDPAAHPLVEWWRSSHPPVRERMRFAAEYDPWSGGRPQYFPR